MRIRTSGSVWYMWITGSVHLWTVKAFTSPFLRKNGWGSCECNIYPFKKLICPTLLNIDKLNHSPTGYFFGEVLVFLCGATLYFKPFYHSPTPPHKKSPRGNEK